MSTQPSPRSLRPRQQRFVDEYLIDSNATRAAISAGYTKRTAAQAGWEVLRNPKVAAEISRRQKLLADRHEVTADNVISELAKIGFANLADFYSIDAQGHLALDPAALSDPAKAAALSQIEIVDGADGAQTIKIKLADKRAALGDLSKHLGLVTERHELAMKPPGEPGEVDNRALALAALALFSEAANDARRAPLLIEQVPSDADFDLDD
jgi:phage terminase small subunit